MSVFSRLAGFAAAAYGLCAAAFLFWRARRARAAANATLRTMQAEADALDAHRRDLDERRVALRARLNTHIDQAKRLHAAAEARLDASSAATAAPTGETPNHEPTDETLRHRLRRADVGADSAGPRHRPDDTD